MATLVYILCALTSGACAALLYRRYRRYPSSLLFWALTCFSGLFIGNILLVVDLVFLPAEIDLSILRTSVALISLTVMIFGFVWEVE
jgi:hypothetical protein